MGVHRRRLLRRQEELARHAPIIGAGGPGTADHRLPERLHAAAARWRSPDGDAIAPRLNELIDSGDFDLVVATRDWHPADHASFREQGGPWPPHCVQGTHGAELHAALDRDRVDAIVDAGYRRDLEGYSGFEETDLARAAARARHRRGQRRRPGHRLLREGTAADALREGFRGHGRPRRDQGIDVQPGDSERALDELRAAGAEVT